MVLAFIEGLVLSFILLLVCVVNIRNGPVGGVHYYSKEVQRRVVDMCLITEAQIKRNRSLSGLAFMAGLLIASPLMVFCVNGAKTFGQGFAQLIMVYLVCGVFDRVFIDWYWVGHTKAWLIEGTEDLMPYINSSAWVKKIEMTIVLYPLLAALLSWVHTLI